MASKAMPIWIQRHILFIVFFSLFGISGCTLHTSKIHSVSGAPYGQGENTGLSKNDGCQWIAIEETFATAIWGLRVAQDAKMHQDALYYCCPSHEQKAPKCIKASWTQRP